MIRIAGPNITIRDLVPQDLPRFCSLENDPQVKRYIGPFTIVSADVLQSELENLIHKYGEGNNDFWVWAVQENKSRVFVGTGAIVRNKRGDDEIGFRLLPEFWKKGYGAETCAILIEYGLRKMHLKKLVAEVDESNMGSRKILDRFMIFRGSSYNSELECLDLHYEIDLKSWQHVNAFDI